MRYVQNCILGGFCLIFCLACQPNKTTDDFPEFTEEQLEQMLKASPEYHKAMREQAQQEKKAGLIDSLEKLYQADTSQVAAAYELAFQYCVDCVSKSTNCQEAVHLFSKVINRQPNYKAKKAYYNRMLCYKKLKNYDAALADLNVFIEHYKNQPILNHYAMRAELLHLRGDSTAACNDVRRAYQLDSLPFDSLVWHSTCLQYRK